MMMMMMMMMIMLIMMMMMLFDLISLFNSIWNTFGGRMIFQVPLTFRFIIHLDFSSIHPRPGVFGWTEILQICKTTGVEMKNTNFF